MIDLQLQKKIKDKIESLFVENAVDFREIKNTWENILAKWNDKTISEQQIIDQLNEDAISCRDLCKRCFYKIRKIVYESILNESASEYREKHEAIVILFQRLWNDIGFKPTITNLAIANVEISNLDLSDFIFVNFTILNSTINNAEFYSCEFRKAADNGRPRSDYSEGFLSSLFNNVNFNGSIFTDGMFLSKFNGCRFYTARFTDIKITACCFLTCDAPKIEFSNVTLDKMIDAEHSHSSIGFELKHKILPNRVQDTDFSSGRFINSSMKGLRFENCGFEYALIENCNFSESELVNINMNFARVNESIFNTSILKDIDFRRVEELKENRFGDVVFSNVLFEFTKLTLPIPEERERIFGKAQKVYRNLKQCAYLQSDYQWIRKFSINEGRMISSSLRKRLMSKDGADQKSTLIFHWIGRWIFGIISDYGESPLKVLWTSIFIIVTSAIIYGIGGLEDSNGAIYQMTRSLAEHDWIAFLKICYFSTITFTTVGYGDIQPYGTSSYICTMIESFLGIFTMGFFVFCVGKRIGTR